MPRFLLVALFALFVFIFTVVAEEAVPPQNAIAKPKPLPAPSNARFNSVVTNKPAPGFVATAGQALTANGSGLTVWANVLGTAINSNPASSGMVLTADGNGGAAWQLSSGFSGVLPVANGGTGSSSQNFVDLTTDQSVAGNKTFTGILAVSTAFVVEAQPNNTGNFNLFIGHFAGTSNTTGYDNTASGVTALSANTTGYQNTASGFGALFSNTTGSNNIAVGVLAGNTIITGSNNIDIGHPGLTDETGITRIGMAPLQTDAYVAGIVHADDGISVSNSMGSSSFVVEARPNNTGMSNVFIGASAGSSIVGGDANTVVGYLALDQNVAGNYNTAIGTGALQSNTGGLNTAIGALALGESSGDSNTALGYAAGLNSAGSNNIYIGIAVGYQATESGVIRIGEAPYQTSTYIAGINGATASGGMPVYVDGNGQLGTLTSSRRFKQNIADMNDQSAAILKLRPVTFQYKPEYDAKAIPQFGLIAEEVNAVDPRLVVRDAKGEIYTVRYEQINAMLLNEFLKDHRRADAKDDEIAALQKENAAMKKRLADQDARLARIEKALGNEMPSAVPASFEPK